MIRITKTQERIISWTLKVFTFWIFLSGYFELKKGNLSEGIWMMTITIISTIGIATMGLSRHLREIKDNGKKKSDDD